MRIKFYFTAPIDEIVARERIICFFEQTQYKVLHSTNTSLEFKRGMLRGMLFSFDPYSWESRVKLVLSRQSGVPDRSDITVEYIINNDPLEHSITKEIWTEEFHRMRSYVLTGETTEFDSEGPKRKVTGFVLDIVGIFVGILIILIAIALILSYRLTGGIPPVYLIVIDGLVFTGGAVFAGWRLCLKLINRRRNSDPL